jgi:hypothetical protein
MNEERQVAKITTCLFFTDKMLWRVKSFCSCVGEDSLFNSEKIDTDAFIGLEGNAFVDRNAQGYIDVKKFILPVLSVKKTTYPLPSRSSETGVDEDEVRRKLDKNIDDDLPF